MGYTYDELDRLVAANLGTWNGSSIVASTAVAYPRVTTWDLDTLGNWNQSPGRTITGEVVLGGPDGHIETQHFTGERNELRSLQTDPDGPGGQSPTQVAHHDDASGNLVSDGEFFYQHDAWGRVVSVHEIGTYDPDQQTGSLGDLICQFSYGGLGRLTRKLSPFPGFPSEYRTEHYYYDGVRRVQEAWSDPISAYSPFSSDEEEGLNPTSWTEREYVHGPAYVDEFVCQVDGSGQLAYVLQDANYNVLALANDDGKVIEQFLWSPYGELLARESYLSFGLNKVGHQGLFFDRFDVPVTQAGLTMPLNGAPPDGLYYNRERSYSAKLGRFVQTDPNGSGALVVDLWQRGQRPIDPSTLLDLRRTYGDGMNLYSYVGASPLVSNDPSGLFFGYFGQLASTTLTTAGAVYGAKSASETVSGLLGGQISAQQAMLELFIDAAIAGGGFAAGKAAGAALQWFAGGTRAAAAAARARGAWVKVNEGMSPRARAYQNQITGRANEAYVLNGTKFDGFNGGTLIDAKGPGYTNFIGRDGRFKDWFMRSGGNSMVRQAEQQLRAADGAPVIWHIAEREALKAISELPRFPGHIILKHTPAR